MKIISFPAEEVENIRNHLKENDTLHTVRISSEFGKYKKGEFVKSLWGERFVVIDLIQVKNFEDFQKRYVHYEELKNKDPEAIKQIANYKKIEILKLKKVNNKNLY